MNPSVEMKPEKGQPLPLTSWFPVMIMGLMSLISYLDRSTLAILSPTILREVHLNAQQYGWIVSAFSFAYMFGNPLWGYLIDRFGPRTVVACAVLIWTTASTAHAYVGTFLGFAIARAVLGLGEGATFPGGLRTADDTLPQKARNRGIAIAYSGGSLGALVTPLIVTPIALKFGWQSAFLFTGIVGALWLVLWRFMGPPGQRRERAPKKLPLPALTDTRLWGFMMLYAFGALPLAFPLYAAPLYLSKAMGLSQALIGKLIWLPPLGWELGYFFAGWACDRTARQERIASWLQPFAVGFTLLALPLGATAMIPELLWGVMALLTLTMFAAGGMVVVALRYGSNAFPGRSGVVAGIGAASWSALVAFVMPLIGRYFDHGEYANAFRLVAVFPIIGLAGWRLLSFTRSALRAERNAEERPVVVLG